MAFELTVDTAPTWVTEQGLNPRSAPLVATELTGGVSASVVAVTGRDVAVVVKQALSRLRVSDRWEAKVDRTESEVAAMRLFAKLTPGAVPRVLAHDPEAHVVAMELLPANARNWQAEIGKKRVHADVGRWAGATLGIWHARTSRLPDVRTRFDDFESFEQLRLIPFYETVMRRRTDLAGAIRPYAAELRSVRRCLVDGDYAPKNMLVAPDGRRWVVDFEVAHIGNPVFDLGFFLSFVLLSAIRWPELTAELRALADGFLTGYAAEAGDGFAGDAPAIAGHTACLVLARTDGTSPAQFLDDPSRTRAREVGIAVLEQPERGLWSWC
jgi:5-methylthioribose kinase